MAKKLDLELDERGVRLRRTKVLLVHPEGFMSLFTKGLRLKAGAKVIEGVPDDAEIVAIAYDWQRNCVGMVVTSKHYPLVPIDQVPPPQMVTFDLEDDK